MGSVETSGPDIVAEHDHPMLDQLFLGLKGCRCHCYAGAEHALLEENMLLHIPLGSKHHVEVGEGDRLAYIWLDYFLTMEGQKYMNEQHQMKDPE
jgi:quercetin dioxygenase-like cupin family protein